MKNIIKIIAILLVFSLCMTGCGVFAEDPNPAIVEITTQSGGAVISTTHDGLNMNKSGAELAVENAYKLYLKDEDDLANIRFYCDVCEHEEVCEFVAPASQLFECDCPEKGDEGNNAREYFAILVAVKSEKEESS